MPSGIYLGELIIQDNPAIKRTRIAYRALDGSVYPIAFAPPSGAAIAKKLIDKTMREIIDPELAAAGNFSHKARYDIIRKAYNLGTATEVPLEPMLDIIENGGMVQ